MDRVSRETAPKGGGGPSLAMHGQVREDAVLQAICTAAQGFFVQRAHNSSLRKLLEDLGQAVRVSRVYLFENCVDDSGTILTSQREEWVKPGIEPQIDNPELQAVSYVEAGFQRWVRELSRRRPIFGLVREFPETEQALLKAQDIISIAVVPIFVKDEWWGFLGFDDCEKERRWSEHEIHTLALAANLIGASILLRKEEELRKETETRYQTIVESSFDGIYIHETEGVVFVNKRLCEMLGYSQVELLGRSFWTLYHPDYQLFIRKRAWARMEGAAEPSSYEAVMLSKDGSPLPVEVCARVVTDKEGRLSYIWVRDLTEKKASEQALKHAYEQYRSIFDNAIEGIFRSTPDGKFVAANPALARIYGYESPEQLMEEVTDIRTQIYVHPQKREEFLGRISAGEHVRDYEIEAFRKDGSKVLTSVSAYGIRDKEGNLVYIEGFIEDITERKREEEERKRLEAEYRHAQKMEAVGTLAGGIAHDFNNLLQAIIGYAEMSLMEEDLNERHRENLRQILVSARRASELTQQLLTFSRKVETRPRPIDLNQQVAHVRKLLERVLPRMIEIDLQLSPDLAPINADPAQIEQVLMNLAVNARDAMPEGGKLIFETQNVILDEQYCNSHVGARPGRYVLLSISDTGSGMDKDTLERIFEPFFTTKGPDKGTGLGLSMVYGIVKAHCGYIMCYSEPGHGTTFKLYWPAIENGFDTEKVEDRVNLTRLRGKETILLVDDEDLVRSVGEEMLERFGYQVLTARSGEEALETYKKMGRDISLVILDLIMPGMGGAKCLNKLLTIDPNAKVLIASGYSEEIIARGRSLDGARGFIRKPYVLRDLLERIRDVLDG